MLKNNMKVAFVLLLATLFTNNSHQQCLTFNDYKIHDRYSRRDLYSGQQDFSLDLLQVTAPLIPHENFLFSPYSIYKALVTTYLLSGGRTENFIAKILHLNTSESKIDLYNAYKLDKEQGHTSTNAPNDLININNIYVSDRITVRDCIPSYFPDELYKFASVSHPEVIRSAINKWADNFTHHMIQELLPPGTIDSSTNLLLATAAYFRGVWESKFNLETKWRSLFVNYDNMIVESVFNYYASDILNAHILELPYQDSISMYVLLPFSTKEDGIKNILKELTVTRFKSFVDPYSYMRLRWVRLYMPKFSLEYTIDLQPILESLGVGDLFKSHADFTKLSNNADISLDGGIHKAKIVVDEKGASAPPPEAYDPFEMGEIPYDPTVTLYCNQPFIFFIFSKLTQTIQFVGIYRKPDKVK